MKSNIHPQVYNDTVITCACGTSFVTSSTKKTISVEICSACHPFYTGQQKFVDTEGRIEKFAKKVKIAEQKQKESPKKAAKGKSKEDVKKNVKVSLKDILQEAKAETDKDSKEK